MVQRFRDITTVLASQLIDTIYPRTQRRCSSAKPARIDSVKRGLYKRSDAGPPPLDLQVLVRSVPPVGALRIFVRVLCVCGSGDHAWGLMCACDALPCDAEQAAYSGQQRLLL